MMISRHDRTGISPGGLIHGFAYPEILCLRIQDTYVMKHTIPRLSWPARLHLEMRVPFIVYPCHAEEGQDKCNKGIE